MTRVLGALLGAVLVVAFLALRLASFYAPITAAACAWVLELALDLLAGREPPAPPHRDVDLRIVYPAS